MLTIGVKENSIVARRLKTSWLEAGERGRPVLFLCHGFPDSASIWDAQIEALSRDYHVIAPFVRGCEDSEPADDIGRYSREAIMLDHLAILAEATDGHEPVVCVGHDLGVVHAMTLARRLGDRLSGVIVINGLDIEMFAERLRDPKQVIRSWYMGLMQFPMLPEAIAKFAPNSAWWLSQSLAGGSADPVPVQKFERRTVAPLNQYRAFARETMKRGELPTRLKAPMLVLWGRDDGVLMPPTQSEWDRVALKAEIRIIPGGHWLHRDHADTVTGFIGKFAEDVIGNTKNV